MGDQRREADLQRTPPFPHLMGASQKGDPVWVEYTIVGYSGKAATEEDSNKFDPGVTLRLLSIGMLKPEWNGVSLQFWVHQKEEGSLLNIIVVYSNKMSYRI